MDRAALSVMADALDAQAKALTASAAGLRALASRPEMPGPNRPMNLKQGAAVIGVSSGFLRNAIRRGDLKAARLGKRCWRVQMSDLLRLQRVRAVA